MTEIKLYMGFDSIRYFNAIMSMDKNKITELESEFDKERKERSEKEYNWLKINLSTEAFEVFSEIDKTYNRHPAFTEDASFWRTRYKYIWSAKDIQFDCNDYGKFDLMIRFKNGKFDLYIDYCDETGYDQGYYNIDTDIEPKNIIERIADMRALMLSGFEIKT